MRNRCRNGSPRFARRHLPWSNPRAEPGSPMEISTSPGEIDGVTAAGAVRVPVGVGAVQAGTIGATSGRAGTTGGATGELMVDARQSPAPSCPGWRCWSFSRRRSAISIAAIVIFPIDGRNRLSRSRRWSICSRRSSRRVGSAITFRWYGTRANHWSCPWISIGMRSG